MNIEEVFSQVDFTAMLRGLAVNTFNVLVASAIVVLFVLLGIFVAAIINRIIRHLFEKVGVEEVMKKMDVTNALRGFTVTGIVTALVKVYVVLAFLGAAANLIELNFFVTVIHQVISYIPMFIQGLLIIIGAVVLTHYKRRVIRETKIPFAHQIALLSTGLVLYIAVIMALPLILPNVDTSSLLMILQTFMISLFVAIALGFGLAIGLGLKEPIAKAGLKHQRFFDNLFEKIDHKGKK